jgi:prepilin-type N-terminal cleavage/methylation domain-containing protein
MNLTDQRGFTIAELLISSTLSLIVMTGVYTVFRSQVHTVKVQEKRMEAHEYALNAIDLMVREIRNAGYFPTGTVCGNVTNTSGVVSATATSFRFVYVSDASSNCNEDVTYSYTGTDITRTYNGTTETLTDGNVTAFQLTYYPQQTSGSAPAALACNPSCNSAERAQIQKLTVSMTVQSKSTDTQFGGASSIVMSLNTDLRNRGLAL